MTDEQWERHELEAEQFEQTHYKSSKKAILATIMTVIVGGLIFITLVSESTISVLADIGRYFLMTLGASAAFALVLITTIRIYRTWYNYFQKTKYNDVDAYD